MTGSGRAGDGPLLTATLVHLRRALQKELTPLTIVHAFQDAGFAVGADLFAELAPRLGADPTETEEGAFWTELNRLFEEKGWGTLAYEQIHPGISVLRSTNWREAEPSPDESQPGCAFTSGVLAHLLGRVAAGPVGVLEVSCRSRGDDECVFAFGAEAAVHELYGHLLDGESIESALEKV